MEIEMNQLSGPSSSRSSSNHRRQLSSNVHKLQDALGLLFNVDDRAKFIKSLNDYHRTRDVGHFVQDLKILLDTTAKQHMIPMLRRVIPSSDVELFDQHVDDENLLPEELRAITKPEIQNHDAKLPPDEDSEMITNGSFTEPPDPTVVKRIRLNKTYAGLGFSIRGGAEHGIGIYVSFVDEGSLARHQGLAAGDQLLNVNEIGFQKITHDEAVRILKSAKQLDLVVKSVGRIPGSYIVHQTYTWVDPNGYPVPPPPEIDRTGRYEARGERKSGLMLLKDDDERKVNVVVDDGDSLGLMIRGGNEFGLGIYITGVDDYSVAEMAGLKVGDQILDVNGQSFLDISHSDAVRILKGSPHMMMTIKDVGKLPYARTTYDQTHWIVGLPSLGHDTVKSNRSAQNGHSSSDSRRESVFSRGAGSQLNYSTEGGQSSQQWALIMNQAQKLLNEEERSTLHYYLQEYQEEHVSLEALMLALFDLLNTHAKFSLLTDIRTIIAPRDIDDFDTMVLRKEVDSMKLTQPEYMTYFPDKTSDYSVSTCDSPHSPPMTRSYAESQRLHPLQQAPLLSAKREPKLHSVQSLDRNARPQATSSMNRGPRNEPKSHSLARGSNLTNGEPSNGVHSNRRSPSNNRTKHGDGLESGKAKERGKMSEEDLKGAIEQIDDDRRNGLNKTPEPRPRRTLERPADPDRPTRLRRTPSHAVPTVTSVPPPPMTSQGRPMTSSDVRADVHSRPRDDVDSGPLHSPDSGVELNGRAPSRRPEPIKLSDPPPPADYRNRQRSPQRSITKSQTPAQQSAPPPTSPVAKPKEPVDKDPTLVSINKSEPTLGIAIEGGANTRQPLPRIINIQKVRIKKTKPVIGIAIVGGAETMEPLPRIIEIKPGGSAHASGGLKVGHVILEVDGQPLKGLEHKDVAQVIARAFKKKDKDYMELLVADSNSKVASSK